MVITVNGAKTELPEGTSAEELLALRRTEAPKFVSVTVNGSFVRQTERASRLLCEGDRVEILPCYMGG